MNCQCSLPSVDPHQPTRCEQCGGQLSGQMARIALGSIGHELRGVHLRLEAVESTQASGSVEIAQRLDRLEQQIADLAEHVKPAEGGWMTAAEAADWLGVSTETVRDHVDQLRGVRLGDGPKARLRFRRADVEAGLDAGRGKADEQVRTAVRTSAAEQTPVARPRPRTRSKVELLPIKGKAA